MKKLPISVCIISGPEEKRIGRALESVASWTEEIIVVINDDVADDTEKIARGFGAKIFREPWKGHVAQKNSAADRTTADWLLGLDADEVVSPELRVAIEQLFTQPEKLQHLAAFSFPRLTCFCGRWIRHGDWYPDRGVRLWRRGQARWGGVDPHDKLIINGRVGKLNGHLLHHNTVSINSQISKIASYSDDFVRDALANGREASWFDIYIRPAWRFARSYIFKLGFLDGWQGCHIAWMTAFYTATRYSKIRAAKIKATDRTDE